VKCVIFDFKKKPFGGRLTALRNLAEAS